MTLAAVRTTYAPGNSIICRGPFVTNVPPMTSVQNVLWTSMSLTNRCMCANVMPTPLKGARSARAASRSEKREQEDAGEKAEWKLHSDAI